MSSRLGPNQCGKAETHLVRVYRDGATHSLRDLTVSVAPAGDLESVHLTGDNANVLPTDTQNNTAYAFAKEAPIGAPEAFALRLARHFVTGPIRRARVEVAELSWARIAVGGRPHPRAKWRHARADTECDESYAEARHALIEAFAATHSLSLQQTLYAMGEAAAWDPYPLM
jgi:urate oxidase